MICRAPQQLGSYKFYGVGGFAVRGLGHPDHRNNGAGRNSGNRRAFQKISAGNTLFVLFLGQQVPPFVIRNLKLIGSARRPSLILTHLSKPIDSKTIGLKEARLNVSYRYKIKIQESRAVKEPPI
jgi:hypothetical protein